jgi:circadian clock protein KaiC
VPAKKRPTLRPLPKVATGITGFDEISHGGLPRHRTTLVTGGPGTGKTVFALQTLINGARVHKHAGIFVAFEEDSRDIFANAATFGWQLSDPTWSPIFFLDARLSPAIVQSGDFELSGMLAILEAKARDLGARLIAFDGIDVLLALLGNPSAAMREIYRLRDWLARSELTAIITTKIDHETSQSVNYSFMQFMVDCVIRFDRRSEQAMAMRRLEITKYRGSAFSPGEFPLNFGPRGIEVATPGTIDIPHQASSERVSTGFDSLDAMLGGGLFRGSSTLITGAPGTSKTTLAGRFAESACRRGERTLFVSFDEGGDRIRRNLTSVGIHLDVHVKSGLLHMYSGRTDMVNPEEHLIRLAALIHEHRPHCMVIDPLSAIVKTGALLYARAVGNRLIYLVQDNHITTFITSLVDGDDPQAEATELQISTIADTWIHLSYLVRGGERNRALTIIKSRGTKHSNQVRELVLSSSGLSLTEPYSSGGEVLMGTLRWERESEERDRKLQRGAEFTHKRRELQFAEADITARIAALQLDLDKQRSELALYTEGDEVRHTSQGEHRDELRKLRGGDSEAPPSARRNPRQARISAKPKTNGAKRQRHEA